MKNKRMYLLPLGIMIIIMFVGLCMKSSYININDEERPLKNFKVGLLNSELVDIQIEHMKKNLQSMSKYILKVECTDTSTFSFHCTTQSVKVEHVFKGDKIEKGDCIEVLKAGTELFVGEDGKSSINMGFVNEMIPGKSYLLFLDRKVQNTENWYIQSEEFMIAPIFAYEKTINVPQNSTYPGENSTDYANVEKNEFFFMDEDSYMKMEEFKELLFSTYEM